jgi:hypothetical protein
MVNRDHWLLKGTFYECCRIEDGHCALWFGRNLPKACTNLATYEIREGHVNNIDMAGIILMFHQDGIGPGIAELMQGAKEGAVYISDNTTIEQQKVLDPFIKEHTDAARWKKHLGTRFVNIKITKENNDHHITMPFGEQKMSLAIGGDRKNPMRLENPPMPFLTDVKFCNTHFWKYHDYAKNLAFENTSGVMANFTLQSL